MLGKLTNKVKKVPPVAKMSIPFFKVLEYLPELAFYLERF